MKRTISPKGNRYRRINHIALTYKCNRNCSYCYAKQFINQFNYLSLQDFDRILTWFDKQNIKSVSLIGGEPTQHPLFNQFIKLINKKKFRFSLLTNGLFNPKFLDIIDKDIVFNCMVNYNPPNMYTKKEKQMLDKNLRLLKKKANGLSLRYNISFESVHYHYIIEACKKYGISIIKYAIIAPSLQRDNYFIDSSPLKKIAPYIVNFVKACQKNNIKAMLDRPLPLCIFNREQREYLKKYGKLHSVCNSAKKVCLINPDLSTYPCTTLSLKGPNILKFKDIKEFGEYFSKKIDRLKWNNYIFPECKECIYRKRRICQGGCLTYKTSEWERLETDKFIIFYRKNEKYLDEFKIVFNKVYNRLIKVFSNITKKPVLYICKNYEDFKKIVDTKFVPEWAIGKIHNNSYICTSPSNKLFFEDISSFCHEVTHLFIRDINKKEVPWWLEEGFCEYVSKPDKTKKLKKLMKHKSIQPFKNLVEFIKEPNLRYDSAPPEQNISYCQSHNFVSFLVKKFGEKTVLDLVKKSGKEDFEIFFYELTKNKFSDVETEWRKVLIVSN